MPFPAALFKTQYGGFVKVCAAAPRLACNEAWDLQNISAEIHQKGLTSQLAYNILRVWLWFLRFAEP
jgi:hypothetical protein